MTVFLTPNPMNRRELEDEFDWQENMDRIHGDQHELTRREMVNRTAVAIIALGIPTIFALHGCREAKRGKEIAPRFHDTIDLNPKEKKPAPAPKPNEDHGSPSQTAVA